MGRFFFIFFSSHCFVSSAPFEVTENVSIDFSESRIGLYGTFLKSSYALSLRRSSKSIDLLLLGTSEDSKLFSISLSEKMWKQNKQNKPF